ncbi:hypothetical protein J437_LFUL004847 [Ladona fulva]|uniref:Bestrophin homolog n=1 Tax=Ladona fulva TaxID=123851 RepID=A0A8K0NZL9_LADFU|nr:hypothetical protein J437_LFUL004847 [Ladona fulva]
MTVSYQYEVASSTSGGFTRLLFKWRGSLYKLIYRELFLFLAAFGILSALYRHVFREDQKRQVAKRPPGKFPFIRFPFTFTPMKICFTKEG